MNNRDIGFPKAVQMAINEIDQRLAILEKDIEQIKHKLENELEHLTERVRDLEYPERYDYYD
jgi:peptidoglycan hydrolase CwlO-like protein